MHLRDLGFNRGYNDECLIDPRLDTCLQKHFSMSCCIYLLLKRFFLLHPREPLCNGHRLEGPFYIIIYFLWLTHLCFQELYVRVLLQSGENLK